MRCLILAFAAAASVGLVSGKTATYWSELGVNPLTKKPFLDGIASLTVTGGDCDTGTSQSPINLPKCKSSSTNALRMVGHGISQPDGFTILHTGDTVQITYKGSVKPVISGGPLDEEYTFLQMHFHWGADDVTGSEHSILGTYGPLEAHFVHYKTSYGTLNDAVTHPDGLAVFAVLFELATDDNPKLTTIFDAFPSLVAKDNTADLTSEAMSWVADAISIFGYHYYHGSLTTTPCSEIVTWLVSKKRIPISSAQVAKFRELVDENGAAITSYRRDVQPLAGRTPLCSTGCVKLM